MAIIDAVAWWLDDDKDHMATDLLEAVAPGDISHQLHTTLLNWKPPPRRRSARTSRPADVGAVAWGRESTGA